MNPMRPQAFQCPCYHLTHPARFSHLEVRWLQACDVHLANSIVPYFPFSAQHSAGVFPLIFMLVYLKLFQFPPFFNGHKHSNDDMPLQLTDSYCSCMYLPSWMSDDSLLLCYIDFVPPNTSPFHIPFSSGIFSMSSFSIP